jgi:hypothetical protein
MIIETDKADFSYSNEKVEKEKREIIETILLVYVLYSEFPFSLFHLKVVYSTSIQ